MTIEAETVLLGGEQDNRYDTILKSRMKGRIEMDKNGESRRLEIEEYDASKKLFQYTAWTVTFLRKTESNPLKDRPQSLGWVRSEPNSGKDRTTVTTGA